ncbi:MAG: outer membrane beta-barrel protein [Bacteroidales bacterium]|nr:outer membrane beta-barrel protein [Bacteroidales bacterium]
MKKASLLTLISILLSIPAFSQFKPFLFGFKASPELGWMKPDARYYESNGVTAFFSWGFVAEFNLTRNYAVATGVNVHQRGGKLEFPYVLQQNGSTAHGILHRQYDLKTIELPVTIKMKTSTAGRWNFYARVGVGTNFMLDAKAKDEFYPEGDNNISYMEERRIKEDVRLIHETLILGFGVEYALSGTNVITGEVNFNNGFTNILKGHNSRHPDVEAYAISNLLGLSVGFIF